MLYSISFICMLSEMTLNSDAGNYVDVCTLWAIQSACNCVSDSLCGQSLCALIRHVLLVLEQRLLFFWLVALDLVYTHTFITDTVVELMHSLH